MHGIVALFARFPWIAGLFSLVAVVVFGWLGWGAWQDYRQLGDAPRRIDFAAALATASVQPQWVEIAPSGWECTRALQTHGWTDILLTSTADAGFIVATYNHEVDCAEVAHRPVSGVLDQMSAKKAARLRKAGLALPLTAPGATGPALCTYCGSGNSRLGVLVCAIFVLICVPLYPLSRYLRGRLG